MAKNSPKRKSGCLLGAHFSIAGGLHRAMAEAFALECTAAQIFTKNANTWKERILGPGEIQQFAAARAAAGLGPVASHTSYLINLANPDAKARERSCKALHQEMLRSAALELTAVVLHPGAHMGEGVRSGLRRVAAGIDAVLTDTPPGPILLLETTAGQGSSLGSRFEELAAIMAMTAFPERLGVCIDSCHVFAAGYDLRSTAAFDATLAEFDRTIGLERLLLIHLNDSKKPLGSHIDRHEHIGGGNIGLEAFGCFMNDPRLANIPKILETPKENDGDRNNLEKLKALVELTRWPAAERKPTGTRHDS
jgi:deoxyribonuclease-4